MDLTIDDLIGTCDGCGGTGKKPSPGLHPRDVRAEDCRKCRGTGRWGLTDAGRAVAELFTVFQKYDAKGHLPFLLQEGSDSSAT